MKKIIVFIFLLFPSLVYSANVCVSPTGSGSKSGVDWNNTASWSTMTFARGNTYYLAGGNYSAKTLSTPASGSTYIYIKKAITASHGTATGWSDTMGVGTATFGTITFGSSYWEFDGQVGYGASDFSNYVPYGFTVTMDEAVGRLFAVGSSGNHANGIHIRHVNAYYTTTVDNVWSYNGYAQVYAYAGEDLQISHSWFHKAAQNNIYIITGNNTVFEYNVFEENNCSQAFMGWGDWDNTGGAAIMHAIVFRYNEHVSNSHFRYNIIRRWRSTGAVGLYSYNDNIAIYGNVFTLDPGGDVTGTWFQHKYPTDSPTGWGGASARIIDGSTGSNPPRALLGYFDNVRIYNNTFADTGTAHWIASGVFGDYTNTTVKNNIFYNVPFSGFYTKITSSYNWYYNVSVNMSSESNVQIGTGDPFINRRARNFRLSAATNAGDSSIGETYRIDPDGSIRGADGIWDRGAYQCNGGAILKIPLFPNRIDIR